MRKRIKPISNKKCFEKECRFKRHELRKLANKKQQDTLNTTMHEQYHDTLAQYKKLVNSYDVSVRPSVRTFRVVESSPHGLLG